MDEALVTPTPENGQLVSVNQNTIDSTLPM